MENAQKSTVYYSRTNSQHVPYEHLSDHLNSVARQARCYGNDIGSPQTAYLCGAVHDLGKYSERFQQVLRGQVQHVNHASAGANIFNESNLNEPMLAEVVFAHHGKLRHDVFGMLRDSLSGGKDEEGRVYSVSSGQEFRRAAGLLSADAKIRPPKPSDLRRFSPSGEELEEMLYERMLLSCLADADYTCAAISQARSDGKDVSRLDQDDARLDPEACLKRLEEKLARTRAGSSDSSGLNALRDRVSDECEAAAASAGEDERLFTLTAPTGIGKTLSMMRFALTDAKKRGLRRIFAILPYLSIIDQNTKDYREICPDLIEDDSQSGLSDDARLYAARYNAPMIVTTSVKFFESLFRSSASDCRRLHNIADSVIMFDEVQTLPLALCDATLKTLSELCRKYNCTVLFSSATQPDYSRRPAMEGRWAPREIIADPQALFAATRRVDVTWKLGSGDPPMTDRELADALTAGTNICAVVNLKKQARALFALLPPGDDSCFLITTDLCPNHRKKVIDEVKRRQAEGLPCRVVATSCIEAGVNLDFDEMYRAAAPLPSVIQCAGRVNRGGKRERGRLTVYLPENDEYPPDKAFGVMTNAAKLLCSRHPEGIDIQDLGMTAEYYDIVFADKTTASDRGRLTEAIGSLDFGAAEKEYRLIPDAGCDVIVPYAGEAALYGELDAQAKDGIDNAFLRRAAPVTVHVYDRPEALPYAVLTWKHGGGPSKCLLAPRDISGEPVYDPKLGLLKTERNFIY